MRGGNWQNEHWIVSPRVASVWKKWQRGSPEGAEGHYSTARGCTWVYTVQWCILGVCITQLTHPSKTYTTHTHLHTFTSDKNCPSFEALRWLFRWSLILVGFSTCSLGRGPDIQIHVKWGIKLLIICPRDCKAAWGTWHWQHLIARWSGIFAQWHLAGQWPAPWTAKAASKSTLPCTDLNLGESLENLAGIPGLTSACGASIHRQAPQVTSSGYLMFGLRCHNSFQGVKSTHL